jgi:hypothetical protein
MPVGTQSNNSMIDQKLTALAVALRNDCQAIANFQEYVVLLGLAGLEAAGYSPADAQTVLTLVSYLNTIAGVYKGTATQAAVFDFSNATCGLWAAQ